jgi:hypothetical protein
LKTEERREKRKNNREKGGKKKERKKERKREKRREYGGRDPGNILGGRPTRVLLSTEPC